MSDPVCEGLRRLGATPDDLAIVRGIPEERRHLEGIPSDEQHERRLRAAARALEVLDVDPARLAASPLGSGWSNDLDLHLPGPADPAVLLRAGWSSLDPLLARIGSPARHQWAVIDGGEVLARADLVVGEPPDPMARTLDRCYRLGSARVREVLEARALVRACRRLPAGHPGTAHLLARDVELGGQLHEAVDGVLDERAAVAGTTRAAVERSVRAAAHLLGRRRLGIALSGCDGAGKSTLARSIAHDLERLGIPVTIAWTRPGMRADGLAAVAQLVKRALGQPPEPGIRAVGRGGGDALASRRGVIGWVWTALVSASFLRDVWSRTAGRRGVVVYDRHALDALVTLEVVYPNVDTRIQRWLLQRLLPRVGVALLVDVDAALARARKPDDLFDVSVLADQVRRYRAGAGPRTNILDGAAPPAEVARDALTRILAGGGS
jgi:hypothetical protein